MRQKLLASWRVAVVFDGEAMFVSSLQIAEGHERVALVAPVGDRAGVRIRSNRNRGAVARIAPGARPGRIPKGLGSGVLGPSTKSALVSDVLGLGDSGSHVRPPTNAAGVQMR
jgi:hypothetical protein